MLYEHQGECPFCHAQIMLTSANAQPTEEELSEDAAEFCTCDGAKLGRGMKATEKKLGTAIGGTASGADSTMLYLMKPLQPCAEYAR